jgi:hypothetical protein
LFRAGLRISWRVSATSESVTNLGVSQPLTRRSI